MNPLPPAALRCDVPGCPDEVVVRVGSEKRCLTHAIARANEVRAARGRPPIYFDDEGNINVVQ